GETHMNDSSMSAVRPKVVVERTYRARVEELWDLWTTKKGFESWWGPEGFRVEVRTLEARVGGALHYDMIADAPEQIAAMKRMGHATSHETRGRFAEIRPHARLAITHVIDFLPGVEPYESTMVVEFFSAGESVRMVVTLDPMHNEEFTRMSTMGFTSQLTKLDRRCGGKRGKNGVGRAAVPAGLRGWCRAQTRRLDDIASRLLYDPASLLENGRARRRYQELDEVAGGRLALSPARQRDA